MSNQQSNAITPPLNLLIIGATAGNQSIFKDYLPPRAYQLFFAPDETQAKKIIDQYASQYFSAYIFDQSSEQHPALNEDNLKTLQNDLRDQMTPIILQIDASQTAKIQRQLSNATYFYLIKPYNQATLISVIEAAVKGFTNHQTLTHRISNIEEAKNWLQNCAFRIQTIEQAKSLSSVLSHLTPDANRSSVGLFELMINAIEHGNLGIGYANKTQLIHRNQLKNEIKKRLLQPENQQKFVTVSFTRKADYLEFKIEDQGQGFDYAQYLEFSVARAMDNHGRGIMIANKLGFDQLAFSNKGSTVMCRINLTKATQSENGL